MATTSFQKLLGVGLSAHTADQLALATVPLALATAGTSAATISVLVAVQALAWLVVSLPAGALADRLPRRHIMLLGSGAIILGSLLAALGISATGRSDVVLAIGVFLGAAGVVLQVLSMFALLPNLIAAERIAPSNAALEFARASVALAAPIAVAALVGVGHPEAAFLAGAAAGALGLIAVAALPAETRAVGARQPLAQAVRDGAAVVAQTPILRAIALCAVFWNFAFFALTAVFAPYALRSLALSTGDVGQLWAIYGGGLLLGAALAPRLLARVRTGWLFVFGPVSAFVGVLTMVTLTPRLGFGAAAIGFFALGFGPMVWLVLQTSVRQIVTPPAYLGRVAATLTTAIYGVRPIGALVAGALATAVSYEAAMWLAAASFAASVAAILVSPAPLMTRMPEGVAAPRSAVT
jgi:predicted MFS family arabinose efflux permease